MADNKEDIYESSPCKRFKSDSGRLTPDCCVTTDEGNHFLSSDCKNDHLKNCDGPSTSEDMYSGADSGFSEISFPVTPSLTPEENTEHQSFFPKDAGSKNDLNDDLDNSNVSPVTDGTDDSQWEDIDDDVASTVSNLSGLSDFSEVSGQGWKPVAGPMSWIQRQMMCGADPHAVLSELVPPGTIIPTHLDQISLWRIIFNMLSEPPCRVKLPDVNTLKDVLGLLKTSKKIMFLTGAGVSVSCGIPDFRSRDGIYARLSKDFPDLPDPQAMFDISYFRRDPRPFFKFAREIYPGQFKPSVAHRFIRCVEKHGKLLRNYTQNIDTLEQVAGISSVIQCHGSFATASCTRCKCRVDSSVIKDDIFNQQLPYCGTCEDPRGCEEKSLVPAIMKPDIVFFGEGLSDEFHDAMTKDKDECDLLIVIGSSLKVRPVALIPSSIPSHVPQILINREPLNHMNFDVELLGDSDIIINELALRLGEGWSDICNSDSTLTELDENFYHEASVNDTRTISENIDLDSQTSSSDQSPCTKRCRSINSGNHFFFEPPSRYVFHGAEISNLSRQKSSSSNESDCLDESTNNEYNERENKICDKADDSEPTCDESVAEHNSVSDVAQNLQIFLEKNIEKNIESSPNISSDANWQNQSCSNYS